MKLTIVGGGGFRVPQIFQALSGVDAAVRVEEIHLHDVAPERLRVIADVLSQLAPTVARPPRLTVGTDLDDALRGADFVFSAMRVGGTAGRVVDESVALDLGVLGQETVGAGGLAYGLRTLPHAVALARRVRDLAPHAWTINFTNPAGMVTEAMRGVLGDRVIGICDSPIGLVRRATEAIVGERRSAPVEFDYVGLNHLGWLRSLRVDGHDRLPGLLADSAALATIEEAQLMGEDWVRALGALPNEYLHYYYFAREVTARIRTGGATRGEFLQAQQGRFYADAAADPAGALRSWSRARHDRESSYMADARPDDGPEDRRPQDVEGGGYQQVALDLMAAISTGRPTAMIVNVANRGTVSGLPDEAVIEVGATVAADGVVPHDIAPVPGHMLGLMAQVKAAEQLLIQASHARSAELAWRAFAAHPLVDSVTVARRLLDDYRAKSPAVAAALD